MPGVFVNEIEKRTHMLSLIPDGDWMFIIDGDEIPFGQLDRLKWMLERENKHVIHILCYDRDIMSEGGLRRPRLVRKLTGMYYDLNHWSLFHGDLNVFVHKDYTDNLTLCPVQLLHFGAFRDKKVTDDKKTWRKTRPL